MSDHSGWGSHQQPGPYGQQNPGGYPPHGMPPAGSGTPPGAPQGVPAGNPYSPYAPSANQPGPYPQPPYGQPQQYGAPQGYGQPPLGQPGGFGYPPPRQDHAKTWWIVGAIVVAALIIGLILFFVLRGDDDAPGGTSGADGRPSYDDVVAGMQTILDGELEAMGITPADVAMLGIDMDAYYACVADGVYDDLSIDGLEAIASGNPDAPMYNNDLQTLTRVSDACLQDAL